MKTPKEYKQRKRELDSFTQLRKEHDEKMREYRQKSERLNSRIYQIKSGNYLKDDNGNPTDGKPLSLKERIKQETEWECLKILAFEDLYTVRHLKGKNLGAECYVVMLGGTVLSTHLNQHEALENWNARLNDEVAGSIDDEYY